MTRRYKHTLVLEYTAFTRLYTAFYTSMYQHVHSLTEFAHTRIPPYTTYERTWAEKEVRSAPEEIKEREGGRREEGVEEGGVKIGS